MLSHRWLSLTLAGSLALATVFLVLLRFSARGLVGCAIALQVRAEHSMCVFLA